MQNNGLCDEAGCGRRSVSLTAIQKSDETTMRIALLTVVAVSGVVAFVPSSNHLRVHVGLDMAKGEASEKGSKRKAALKVRISQSVKRKNGEGIFL